MNNIELFIKESIDTNGICVCLKPSTPGVLTPSLVTKIRYLQNSLVNKYLTCPWKGQYYVIWYSHKNHGRCENGLDFKFIYETIINHQDSQFEHYIKDLFNLLFFNYIGLGLPLINCSIIDRAISGMSQEFYLLNQVNFLSNVSLPNPTNSLLRIDSRKVACSCLFPQKFYKKNNFYIFQHYDTSNMKKVISEINAYNWEQEELNKVELFFDRVKEETIDELYNIASKKMSLLATLAQRQGFIS